MFLLSHVRSMDVFALFGSCSSPSAGASSAVCLGASTVKSDSTSSQARLRTTAVPSQLSAMTAVSRLCSTASLSWSVLLMWLSAAFMRR